MTVRQSPRYQITALLTRDPAIHWRIDQGDSDISRITYDSRHSEFLVEKDSRDGPNVKHRVPREAVLTWTETEVMPDDD